jgi:hypothetical protein
VFERERSGKLGHPIKSGGDIQIWSDAVHPQFPTKNPADCPAGFRN